MTRQAIHGLVLLAAGVLLASHGRAIASAYYNLGAFFHMGQANPTALALAQSNGYRTFTVSWTGGAGNGGASGCKLQYLQNGSTWTDLTGSTYNCDATTVAAAAAFPTTSFWTNNFNATGVSVRLVRVSDGTTMGAFPQKATCTPVAGSPTSTPNIDEDCDGQWDNTTTVAASCTATPSTLTIDQSYTCPATLTCGAFTATFSTAVFTGAPNSMEIFPSTNGTCTGTPSIQTPTATYNSNSSFIQNFAAGANCPVTFTYSGCTSVYSYLYTCGDQLMNPAFTTFASGVCNYVETVYH